MFFILLHMALDHDGLLEWCQFCIGLGGMIYLSMSWYLMACSSHLFDVYDMAIPYMMHCHDNLEIIQTTEPDEANRLVM